MKRRIGERGQALPLIGISLMVLLGFGAATIDVSNLEYQQTRMQAATDAAAIAGAQELITKGCPDQTDATTAANGDSQIDNFAPSGSTIVTVHNPPTALDGPYSGDPCSVHVSVQVPATSTWFLKLFGYSSMPVETEATAQVQNTNPACIYLLSPNVVSDFHGGDREAPQCGMLINDTATFDGGTVDFKYIGYAGATPAENGTKFTEASPAKMLPVADPCPEIAGCAYLAANPPSTSGCIAWTGQNPVTPNCYSSLDVHGTKGLVFEPGLYVLNGVTDFHGASITGSGVTFYVTASGTPMDFNGTTVTFSPPTSGNYNGVLYYQVPANSVAPVLSGTKADLSGLIYAPTANDVTFNGGNGGYVVLVFGSLTFNGGETDDFGMDATTLPNNVVLVQ